MVRESPISIDSDVPVPRPRGAGAYPFARMKIGDSFLVDEKLKDRVGQAIRTYTKHHKSVKFTRRKTRDGARFWRIA